MHSNKFADAEKRKITAESYLLNLYPVSGNENNATLLGTVEKLGNEDKHTFHSIRELLHLLGIDEVKSGDTVR